MSVLLEVRDLAAAIGGRTLVSCLDLRLDAGEIGRAHV